MKGFVFRFLICSLWSLYFAFGSPILSSAADDEHDRSLDERILDFLLERGGDEDEEVPRFAPVTIIASRLPSFKTRLSNIPSNISYIPANVTHRGPDELSVSNPRNFQDSIRDIEGSLFYDQVGNGIDTTFGLRGFTESGSIAMIVDGVRVNELDGGAVNYPLLPMNDVESIQIGRGSASHVYGSGTFAGVVHITTRKPSKKKMSFFGSSEWSSFGGVRWNQGVSGSIPDELTPLEGVVTYYFNMGRDLNDGFRDNGEWRITNLDVKFGYELPDEAGGIRAGVKYVDDAVSNPGALTVDEFHADSGQTANPLDGRDFRNTIVQMEAEKKFFNNRVVASVLAYWRVNLIHFFTTSRTFPDPPFNPDTDLVTVRSRATDLIWQLAHQDKWDWLGSEAYVGMEFRDASEHAVEQDAFLGNVVETSPRETERTTRPEFFSLFWRETASIAERVITHFGMRHDWHTLKTDDQLMRTNNLSRRWRDSTLSAGVTVKPVDAVDLFFNYSQGFRVPTISEVAPFSAAIATDLNPEKTDSYEAGARMRFRDILQGKFSLFVIDVKEEILFDSTAITVATPFGRNVNVGKSRRRGAELRVDANPIPEVDLFGSYTGVKAYVRESPGGGIPFDGREIGLVPRNRFTMGATLRPLHQFGSPYEGLVINMNGIYTGEQFVQSFESSSQANLNAGGEKINGYMIWNGTVSFNWKGKRIYFKINNIFDKHYYSRGVTATNFGSAITVAGTHLFVNPGAPREYLIGATWEMG